MPTRQQYRRAIATALNDLEIHTVTSATSSTVTVVRMADSTTGAAPTRFDGAWVYIATGAGQNQQRRAKNGGFDPVAGVLTVVLPWFAPQVTDEIEITRLLPAIREIPGDTSYNDLIDRSLSMLMAPDRLTLPITTSDQYPMTAYTWLDRPERLVRVLEPSPVAGRAPVDASWRNPRLVVDGATPFLQLDVPFGTATDNLTLEVLRPGDSLISGGESTTGLVAEASTALPSIADVRTVALMEFARVMLQRTQGRPDGANWERRFADAREQAERLTYFDRTRLAPSAPSGQEAAA